MKDIVQKYRQQLIEKVAELDDALMEKYLDGQEITIQELKKNIRKGVINNQLNPIFCGSALKNKGVQPLLDAITEYLPSPIDIPHIEASEVEDESKKFQLKPNRDGNFAGLAFKIASDQFGSLTFFRVYSGLVKKGDSLYIPRTGKSERVGRIVLMHSNSREDVEEVRAGEIAAFIGLKDVRTGDTLCSKTKPMLLESINFPDPVISVAVEPKTKSDQEKMSMALTKLLQEDPSLRVGSDDETGQTILSGMGELHLDIIVDRMKREYKVEANIGAPQVAYKEAIRKEVEMEGKYVKQSGGRGQYGHCWLRIRPNAEGTESTMESKIKFNNLITGGVIPKEYIPSIQKGCEEVAQNGALAGYPVLGVEVDCYDGSYHDVDSSEVAFKQAGAQAMKAAILAADPVLLEPIMNLEIVIPEEYMGDVIGDVNSRRGQILASETRGKQVVVKAEVPLENLFGYISDLRGRTKGQGTASMEFSRYAETPKNIQEKIIEGKNT
jgi:elongation factor G